MKHTPFLSGSTPCRSAWTASPSVSHSWTPKKRNVSVVPTQAVSHTTSHSFGISDFVSLTLIRVSVRQLCVCVNVPVG